MNTTEPQIDYVSEIQRLKKQRKAVILAHNYERPEIQEIADFTGDSLGLSQKAQSTDAEVILFCGVHFMAETASILNPSKKVLLPDPLSGCSMADMVSAEALLDLKEKHPSALVVSYVNTTAQVKAESDICCTSSNAREVVESLPKDKPVIFLPDKYLGEWVRKQTGRDMILWEGWCPIHMEIREYGIQQLRLEHPKAWLVAHPEARPEVTAQARIVASTEGMIKACQEAEAEEFIIATETGILHKLRRECPSKKFYAAGELAVCPYMKRTDLKKCLLTLRDLNGEVRVPEALRQRALLPIQRMLDLKLPFKDSFVGCQC